jgi:hypothetical protein
MFKTDAENLITMKRLISFNPYLKHVEHTVQEWACCRLCQIKQDWKDCLHAILQHGCACKM